MEHNLFRYIWRNSWRDQSVILVVVAISYVFYFVSLDLPKQIVNQAIHEQAFADGQTTAPFLDLSIGPIDWLGLPEVTLFQGFQLDKIAYLVALCFSFLFFVVVNGWIKQLVNTEKGRLGERMLRRLRYELYDRVLRFPIAHFRKVKQAEVATMIKDEVEPLGGFIGDAYITPAFLGGQALTALSFILIQNVWLGLISVVVLTVQLVMIPLLRRRILELGRQRQLTARQLAGRIAENVDGTVELHANDTSNYERADIVNRLEKIFLIRFELYQRKFFVKYLNNMLSQTTPFLFYLIGGYFALKGQFDVGALVAVINAYKDLPSPIKELIDWQQQSQDVQIKYEQVIEQFTPEGMLPPELQAVTDDVLPAPEGGLSAQALSYYDEGGGRLLDNAGLEIGATDHLAIVGFNGSGKEALGLLLARLVAPSTGTLRWGEEDMTTLPESVTGRHISYVGDETYLFPHSILENVVYGLKHRPIVPAQYEGRALMHFQRRISEAKRTGNPLLDIHAQWIDFGAAGVEDISGLKRRIIELLPAVELEDDVYQFGLRGRIDPDDEPAVAERFLEARVAIHRRLQEPDLAHLVEQFDPAKYNRNMTVAENLLFGTPRGAVFDFATLRDNKVLAKVIEAEGLKPALDSDGRADRQDHGRAVRRLAAGPSLLRAVQLRLGRRPAAGAAVAGPRAAQRPREGRGSRPAAADRHYVSLYRGPAPLGPDRCRAGGQAAGGAAQLCRDPAGGISRLHRVLRPAALQRRRDGAGQHAVRPPDLRPGPGRAAHLPPAVRGGEPARPQGRGAGGRAGPWRRDRRPPPDPAAAAEGRAGARPGAPAADSHPQQRAGAARGRRADPHPQGDAERNEGPLLDPDRRQRRLVQRGGSGRGDARRAGCRAGPARALARPGTALVGPRHRLQIRAGRRPTGQAHPNRTPKSRSR